MKNIIIIVKKEIKDLMRDKRTMLTMILIPLLIFPLIMSVVGRISSSQIQKEIEKKIKITFVGKENADSLYNMLISQAGIEMVNEEDTSVYDSLLQSEIIDAAIFIESNFDSIVSAGDQATILVKHKASNWGTRDKINSLFRKYEDGILQERLIRLNIKKETIEPLHTNYVDISTKREKFGKSVGGIVPYIFLIFGFIGCMYPAIDLFTNEKERGTIETILTTPVNRIQILFGKMIVVSLAGLTSALLSIVGVSLGMKQFGSNFPEEVLGALNIYSDPLTILLLFSMMIPLVIFFAGILTLFTNYARSYKEAQSLISPMMILIIVPAVISMMPGMKLTFATAIIPIMNISLASKEILAGTLNFGHYALVITSLCLYAVISVFIAKIWFGREENVLRM